MKQIIGKLGLLSLVLLTLSSCKPKIDMDYVNELVGKQTKMAETVEAVKANTTSMEGFQATMMNQIKEMTAANASFDGSGMVSQITNLLSDRGSLVTKLLGLTTDFGGLIDKYKGGSMKLKDVKSQFSTIETSFGDMTTKIGDNDAAFASLRDKFSAMYAEAMAKKQ